MKLLRLSDNELKLDHDERISVIPVEPDIETSRLRQPFYVDCELKLSTPDGSVDQVVSAMTKQHDVIMTKMCMLNNYFMVHKVSYDYLSQYGRLVLTLPPSALGQYSVDNKQLFYWRIVDRTPSPNAITNRHVIGHLLTLKY